MLVDVLLIERQEVDDVVLGGRAVPFRELRRVARGCHQRLPLLGGTNRQVKHEVEIHLDEPRDVLRALDVAAHPVDRIGYSGEAWDWAPPLAPTRPARDTRRPSLARRLPAHTP